MGGRGAWAARHRVGGTFTAETIQSAGAAAASAAAEQASTNRQTEDINGVSFSGASDKDIQDVLGANFSRSELVKISGAAPGSRVTAEVIGGGQIKIQVQNTEAGFRFKTRLGKDAQGVVFYGDSLFSSNTNRASGGAAIRGLKNGLGHAVENNLVYKVVVPQAIGNAGDLTAQGSLLWAKLGASTDLSNIYSLPARPASLASARTVSDLMVTKEGAAWWRDNRREFRGTLDFRDTTSNSYKLAEKFIGAQLSRRRR